jgi:hypothetical protein
MLRTLAIIELLKNNLTILKIANHRPIIAFKKTKQPSEIPQQSQ